MKPRILFINPWIHDFAAFNLWARPLGLLKAVEYFSAFDAELIFIDCADSFHPDKYGTGKYRSEIIQKPEMLKNVPRYFKRYGVSAEEFTTRLKSMMPFDIVLMTSIMSYWYTGVWRRSDSSGRPREMFQSSSAVFIPRFTLIMLPDIRERTQSMLAPYTTGSCP